MPDALSLLLMLLLRWIHFVGGVTWIGTIFYLRLVGLPSMASSDGNRLSSNSVSRLNLVLVTMSITGLTAGVVLALVLSGLDANVFATTVWGLSVFAGAIFALTALVATFAGVMPILEQISAGGQDTRQRALLFRRGKLWLNLAAIFGVLVLLMMAYAGSLGGFA